MPRTARLKSDDSTYHIMCRANGDDLLFRNSYDKEKYLEIMRKYQKIYNFKVYAYCLMDTHCHFMIYANGADISDVMHSINQSYAQGHYNKVYHRRGHVFADRFKSKIIDDEIYHFTVWGYIHNNPYEIKEYENCVEKYPYSSLNIYLGNSSNLYGLVDLPFMTNIFSKDIILARKKMINFVKDCNTESIKEEMEFKVEKQEYRSEKYLSLKEFKPDFVVNFVANYLKCDEKILYLKNKKVAVPMRSLCVFMLKSVCGLTDKKICVVIGNVTQSSISRMLKKALELIELEKYKDIYNCFLETC